MKYGLKAVVPHGGHGTRLRPFTHTGPKQLVPIANKPTSQYVLEDLSEAGIRQVAVVLGDLHSERVREKYGDGRSFGLELTYIYQPAPRGIADAVGLCKDFIGKNPFVVYLGDNLLKGGIKGFAETFRKSGSDAMVLLCDVRNPGRFGVAKFDKERLVGLIEKPAKPPSKYALAGVYFFKPIVFQMIEKLKPSWRGELEITEAIQSLIDGGYQVDHQFVKGWWKDTGTPEDILEANQFMLDQIATRIEGKVEKGGTIEGRVVLEEGSVVKSGALIRGPAVVGRGAIIGSEVYVGPYTSIGNNVTISRGEVENSVIMDSCRIDIADRLVDSLIGSHSEIVSKNSVPRGKRLILGERSHMEV